MNGNPIRSKKCYTYEKCFESLIEKIPEKFHSIIKETIKNRVDRFSKKIEIEKLYNSTGEIIGTRYLLIYGLCEYDWLSYSKRLEICEEYKME